jgi:hypothetical protein
MPIGRISASIGDIIGSGDMGFYIDSGVLTYKDTLSMEYMLPGFDLSKNLSSEKAVINLYDKLSSFPFFTGKLEGNDSISYTLEFPITIRLQDINNANSMQRLDSASFTNARCITMLDGSASLPIQWQWIDGINLELGEAFHRQSGKSIVIYQRGDRSGYGQDIPFDIDNFSLNMMKDKNPSTPDSYLQNVNDSCDALIRMTITIPSSAGIVTIANDAEIHLTFRIQEMDYLAVWGMFFSEDDMHFTGDLNISELMNSFAQLKQVQLPFADPSIEMQFSTEIAAAPIMHINHLYAQAADANQVYATFDGSKSLTHKFLPTEYLTLDSEIGDRATMKMLFDKDPARGCLDQLFSITPQKLVYDMSMDIDKEATPQVRFSKNTNIHLDAIYTFPMVFNEGLILHYVDTLPDIDLSIMDLDSMTHDLTLIDTIEDATLKLALKIENYIPVQLTARFYFLDENDNTILQTDTVLIPSPKYNYNQSSSDWDITSSVYKELVRLDEDTLEEIVKTQKIVYDIMLDDKSLQDSYDQGDFHVQLTDSDQLFITIGIGADVEAVLNMNSLNTNNNQ